MNKYIKVKYTSYTTQYTISKVLEQLELKRTLSFDLEVQPIYSIEERAEAKALVKNHQSDLSSSDLRISKVVANCSGLSHPIITKVTHVIFGLSESESIIFIIPNHKTEVMVLDWVTNFKGKLLVHNSLFDLKIVHHRTFKFPNDIEDTQLLAKCLINHSQDWECRTGLKHLMGGYYDPKWQLFEDYDAIDLKNEAMLEYAAIDGAATFKLWNDLQRSIHET